MKTPYSADNGAFSDRAHLAAQRLIYPRVFATSLERLIFEDTQYGGSERAHDYDATRGVDRRVGVIVDGLREPLYFTIQERFRQMNYARFRDITITEFNQMTSLPGELYKIEADLFTYAYFDDRRNCFGEGVVVDVALAKLRLCGGDLIYGRGKNPRSKQDFITLTFDNLRRANAIVWHGKGKAA